MRSKFNARAGQRSRVGVGVRRHPFAWRDRIDSCDLRSPGRSGGKLEIAQQMAGYESAQTPGLHHRCSVAIALDEAERIIYRRLYHCPCANDFRTKDAKEVEDAPPALDRTL
jgi:hypothetical protein